MKSFLPQTEMTSSKILLIYLAVKGIKGCQVLIKQNNDSTDSLMRAASLMNLNSETEILTIILVSKTMIQRHVFTF